MKKRKNNTVIFTVAYNEYKALTIEQIKDMIERNTN